MYPSDLGFYFKKAKTVGYQPTDEARNGLRDSGGQSESNRVLFFYGKRETEGS
jgi:hypothetical protein